MTDAEREAIERDIEPEGLRALARVIECAPASALPPAEHESRLP